jgi:hypothetical protein
MKKSSRTWRAQPKLRIKHADGGQGGVCKIVSHADGDPQKGLGRFCWKKFLLYGRNQTRIRMRGGQFL